MSGFLVTHPRDLKLPTNEVGTPNGIPKRSQPFADPSGHEFLNPRNLKMLRPSLSTIFLQKIPEMMKNPTCVLKKTCSFCKLWNFEPFKKNIPGNSAGDPFRTVIQRDPFQWLLVTSNLGKLKVTYWLNCQGSPLPNSKYNAYPTIRKRRSSSSQPPALEGFFVIVPWKFTLGTSNGAGCWIGTCTFHLGEMNFTQRKPLEGGENSRPFWKGQSINQCSNDSSGCFFNGTYVSFKLPESKT